MEGEELREQLQGEREVPEEREEIEVPEQQLAMNERRNLEADPDFASVSDVAFEMREEEEEEAVEPA